MQPVHRPEVAGHRYHAAPGPLSREEEGRETGDRHRLEFASDYRIDRSRTPGGGLLFADSMSSAISEVRRELSEVRFDLSAKSVWDVGAGGKSLILFDPFFRQVGF